MSNRQRPLPALSSQRTGVRFPTSTAISARLSALTGPFERTRYHLLLQTLHRTAGQPSGPLPLVQVTTRADTAANDSVKRRCVARDISCLLACRTSVWIVPLRSSMDRCQITSRFRSNLLTRAIEAGQGALLRAIAQEIDLAKLLHAIVLQRAAYHCASDFASPTHPFQH